MKKWSIQHDDDNWEDVTIDGEVFAAEFDPEYGYLLLSMKPETGSRFYDGKHPGKPVWLVMNIAQMKKLKEIIDSSDNTN